MRRTVMVVAGAIALVPTVAHAGDASLHAMLDGDVALTDNVFSTPDGGLPGTPREADVYVQVRPGLLFAYDTPRMIQELSASLDVLEYVRNYGTPTLNFRGKWSESFTVSPATDVLTVLSASTGVANALTARTSADNTPIAIAPAGSVDIDEVDATEHVTHQLSKALRVGETAYASYTTTNDNMGDTTTSGVVTAAVTMDRVWQASTLGLDLGANFIDLDIHAVIVDPTVLTSDHEIDPHLYAVGRHDFNRHWTASLTAGAVEIIPTISGRQMETVPVATGVVGYTDYWGYASLTLSRAVAPNVFIAANTVTDSATANVSLPLPWLHGPGGVPVMFATGVIGANQTQFIDEATGDLTNSFDLFRADVGVSWLMKPGVSLGLRYDYIDQHADTVSTLIPGFTRSTLFFEFSVMWPPRVRGIPTRQGMRADGGDAHPVGEEVVVPENAAPAADGTSNGGPGPGSAQTPP